MRKLSLLFILLIATMSQISAQKTYQGKDLNQSKNEKLILANGDHAFSMIVGGGGGGTTGWTKMHFEPLELENIGPDPDASSFLGGDFGQDGKWYTTEHSGGFYVVDTITTEFTLLANWGITPSGFTYSPAYETHYVCSGSDLYTVNMDTYTLELIGPMGNSGNMVGIGADFRGKLWGIDTNDDKLYSIDPVTGLATSIGETGHNFDYLQGCTYDKSNDRMLHGAFWVSPSVYGGLLTYDLETGAAIELGQFATNDEVTVISVPWTLPAHGSISGLVSDASNGNPVADVEMKLEATDGSNGSYIIKSTEDDGLYSYGLVLPGTYKITATSSSFGIAIENNIIVNDGDELEINFELSTANNSASFTVFKFTDNTPIENVLVEFAGQEASTDASGMVSFENIASGIYEYTTAYSGYYEGFGDLEIIEGSYEQNIILYELNNVTVDKVIIEEATGTWCGPCAGLAPTLDLVYEDGFPVNFVAYHASDPYENSFASARNGYYGVVAYPTLTYMGLEQTIGGIPQSQLEATINDLASQETPVAISLINLDVDVMANTVIGTAKIENFGPINSDHMRLQLVLVENHIPEEWQGLPELNFVERTMFPNESGTELDLTEVGEGNYEFYLSLDDILDFDHSTIVAFVQDNFTKEIYNGTSADCSLITGISDISSNQILLLPNPATNHIYIKSEEGIESMKVYNNTGQLMMEKTNFNSLSHQLNIEDLANGVYFIKIETSDNEYTQKLIKK